MSIVKTLAVFILGGACGGAAGWIFCKKKMDKKMRADVESVRKYYKDMYAPKEASEPVCSDEFLEVAAESVNDVTKEPDETAEVKKNDIPKPMPTVPPEYHDYCSHYNGGAPMSDDNYDENYALGLQASEDSETANKLPYVVDEIVFDSDEKLSETVANYYIDNGVLTIGGDYDEEEVFNFAEQERMLGDTIAESGFANDDNDTLFVFNESMGTKYRINKMFAKYVE